MTHHDEHFRLFAGQIEKAILKYGDIEEIVLVERQKKQMETLVKLEKKFRKALIRHKWGPSVYRAFVDMIVNDRKNILAARPYFRERQDIFTTKIAKALKRRKTAALYRFHFNYQFVRFVMQQKRWGKNSDVRLLAREIELLRTEIIEMNMPLAISRARIFWSRTPHSHLTYMDLIQISCEGLMSAVDKFVLPYSTVFRSVAIGRIVGNFIENYSETLIHFYPQDKRKIYRANKLMSKLDEVDFDELAVSINEGIVNSQKTNASEISNLVAAASTVSADSSPPQTEENEVSDIAEKYEKFAADSASQPDAMYEGTEISWALRNSLHVLTEMEKKLLKLKGIAIS